MGRYDHHCFPRGAPLEHNSTLCHTVEAYDSAGWSQQASGCATVDATPPEVLRVVGGADPQTQAHAVPAENAAIGSACAKDADSPISSFVWCVAPTWASSTCHDGPFSATVDVEDGTNEGRHNCVAFAADGLSIQLLGGYHLGVVAINRAGLNSTLSFSARISLGASAPLRAGAIEMMFDYDVTSSLFEMAGRDLGDELDQGDQMAKMIVQSEAAGGQLAVSAALRKGRARIGCLCGVIVHILRRLRDT